MQKILFVALLLLVSPLTAHGDTVVSSAAQCTGASNQVRTFCCSSALTNPAQVLSSCTQRGAAEQCGQGGLSVNQPTAVMVCMLASTPQQGRAPSETGGGAGGGQGTFYPIVPIKNITDTTLSFPEYAKRIFNIFIQLGALLAVLMIVYGGFEYMTSAAGITKKDGAEKIRNAVTGLILLLASYLILSVINPCLVTISIFSTDATPCSAHTTPQTTNPSQSQGQNTDTQSEDSSLSSLTPPACLQPGNTCPDHTAGTPICTTTANQTQYRPLADGATCSGAGEQQMFLCSDCSTPDPGAGVTSLNPLPHGMADGACTTAHPGTTLHYCCVVSHGTTDKTVCGETADTAACGSGTAPVTVCALSDTTP